ncbi:MAG: acylphosphatase [Proteobacteria bacterium]|nr:acylphosphatase [Pseudomonadota bacterium]
MKQLRARIVGRVQGVYFRASTRNEARRLGLRGWVRNCADGAVELLAEGPEQALGLLLAWCRHGPPAAQVEAVEAQWAAATGEDAGFEVRH